MSKIKTKNILITCILLIGLLILIAYKKYEYLSNYWVFILSFVRHFSLLIEKIEKHPGKTGVQCLVVGLCLQQSYCGLVNPWEGKGRYRKSRGHGSCR